MNPCVGGITIATSIFPVILGIVFFTCFIILANWVRKGYDEISHPQQIVLFCGSFIFVAYPIAAIFYIIKNITGSYEALGALLVMIGIMIFGLSNIHKHFTHHTQYKKKNLKSGQNDNRS